MAVVRHHGKGNLCKRQFIWVYGSRGLESMMVEWRRQHEVERERELDGNGTSVKTLNIRTRNKFLHQDYTYKIYPNRTTNWEPNIQTSEITLGDIIFKPPQGGY